MYIMYNLRTVQYSDMEVIIFIVFVCFILFFVYSTFLNIFIVCSFVSSSYVEFLMLTQRALLQKNLCTCTSSTATNGKIKFQVKSHLFTILTGSKHLYRHKIMQQSLFPEENSVTVHAA